MPYYKEIVWCAIILVDTDHENYTPSLNAWHTEALIPARFTPDHPPFIIPLALVAHQGIIPSQHLLPFLDNCNNTYIHQILTQNHSINISCHELLTLLVSLQSLCLEDEAFFCSSSSLFNLFVTETFPASRFFLFFAVCKTSPFLESLPLTVSAPSCK